MVSSDSGMISGPPKVPSLLASDAGGKMQVTSLSAVGLGSTFTLSAVVAVETLSWPFVPLALLSTWARKHSGGTGRSPSLSSPYASGAKSSAKLSSLDRALSHSRPLAPSAVSTRWPPFTDSVAPPPSAPGSKGPPCSGNGKSTSSSGRAPPRSSSSWFAWKSFLRSDTSSTKCSFCFWRSVRMLVTHPPILFRVGVRLQM
mmetsp:Transcript_3590/g.9551  ORF Transcript_3590/g.9551 Transcript_3590/m.9551 type:complete len:201 (+) Transcript_3590:446-1048(+)